MGEQTSGSTASTTTATAQTGGETGKTPGQQTTGQQASTTTSTKPGQQTTQGKETGKTQAPPTILDGSVARVREDTASEEDAGTEGGAPAAAAWPDDWREQISGGNAEVRKIISRYASPQSLATALVSLRQRLNNGEFKKALGKDATPDEIVQHRKDYGIPEKSDGYEMPKGIEISDADKPIIAQMLDRWHGENRTPEQVSGDIAAYFAAREAENQQMYDKDIAYRDEQLDTLSMEIGPKNMPAFRNTLKNFVPNFFGKELAASLMGARLGDGTLAGNNGAFLKKMYEFAKLHAPEQTLTGAGEGMGGKALDDRIAEIETIQKTDRNKYFADQRLQDEYKGLIEMQLKRRKAA